MRSVAVVLGVTLTLALVSRSHAFNAGDVCDGVDIFGPAANMLRGRTLTVLEMEWAPFAEKDPSASQGWVGIDIDLLDRLAQILGFTYIIQEMDTIGTETWSDMLDRVYPTGDLVLSYWARTEDRVNMMSMLAPHIDYSPVMVVPMVGASTVDNVFLESARKLAAPFDVRLIVLIFSIVIMSGVIDYLLERREGGTIQDSIYEYFSGTLWGGFATPRTGISAVYQVLVALFVIIIIAAYTANLAAFLTNRQQPRVLFNSIEELMTHHTPACIRTNDPLEPLYRGMHPSLKLRTYGISELTDRLEDGSCKAVLMPRTNFDRIKSDGYPSKQCHLQMALQGSLSFQGAGWITNPNSSVCVQRPIEMALAQLANSGELENLLVRWVQPAECNGTESIHVRASNITETRDDADGTADEGEDLESLQIVDISFLIAMWVSATVIALGAHIGLTLHCRRKSGQTLFDFKQRGILNALFGAPKERSETLRLKGARRSNVYSNVNIQKLLSKLGDLQTELEAVQQATLVKPLQLPPSPTTTKPQGGRSLSEDHSAEGDDDEDKNMAA